MIQRASRTDTVVQGRRGQPPGSRATERMIEWPRKGQGQKTSLNRMQLSEVMM